MGAGAPREQQAPRARGFRRLTGLDRSGPLPAQTRAGQPLRPLTIPNMVGYLRLASIPVFLVLALNVVIVWYLFRNRHWLFRHHHHH